MNKTKIDWADSTWNPVTGCYHSCDYCYARKIVQRFDEGYVFGSRNDTFCLSDKAAKYIINPEIKEQKILMAQHRPIFKNIGILDAKDKKYAAYPFGFCPTFHKRRINENKSKKGRTIFVCSMADLFGDWVPDEWIKEVFEACEAAPQHRYLFLTKNPQRCWEMMTDDVFPNNTNFWFGTTITSQTDFNWAWACNHFYSIEPLSRPIDLGEIFDEENGTRYIDCVKWVIVGAETGNRKNKVVPKREWIEDIVKQCRSAGVPVFMKESLREIMGDEFVQEFPWTEGNQ